MLDRIRSNLTTQILSIQTYMQPFQCVLPLNLSNLGTFPFRVRIAEEDQSRLEHNHGPYRKGPLQRHLKLASACSKCQQDAVTSLAIHQRECLLAVKYRLLVIFVGIKVNFIFINHFNNGSVFNLWFFQFKWLSLRMISTFSHSI